MKSSFNNRATDIFYFFGRPYIGKKLPLYKRLLVLRVAYVSVITLFNREVYWLLKVSQFFVLWSLLCKDFHLCFTLLISLNQCLAAGYFYLVGFADVKPIIIVPMGTAVDDKINCLRNSETFDVVSDVAILTFQSLMRCSRWVAGWLEPFLSSSFLNHLNIKYLL